MLKIVRSGFSMAAREEFCREISALVSDGKRAILIVPEQQTVIAESLFASILPPSSALCFEVTNFTRLANTTFRSLGGLSGEYCDRAKKSLIMWRTLTELAPTLSMTSGRREIGAGLVESALAAVSEMQNLGISPADLSDDALLSGVREDNRLSSKITDLASIFALYKKLLSERYSDTGDDAEAMIKKLSENHEFLVDTTIFIDGFTSFTQPQYRLIGLLSERTTVKVSLNLPKGREDAFEFTEILECQRRLTHEARRSGAEIKLSREEGNSAKIKESLREICLNLWSTIKPNDNISLQNSEDLRIFEAKTPYEECTFVCEDIKRRVMGGAHFSDFAIISRDGERYSGILDHALSMANIPAFTSYRRDAGEFEAIKLIYTAYSAIRGFSRVDVITYAKCALSGITREECDELEMYVSKWQISGRRFTDGEVWNMNPEGYTLHRADDIDEKLVRINDIRRRIIDPLYALALRASSAKTVMDHARALLDFLLEINMESALEDRAAQLSLMGESSLAEENLALWKIICDGLDTLVTVLGGTPADSESFLSQLRVVFSAVDVGRIPAYVDRVTVGGADMLRLYEKKHIYLMGVNAGVFPATVSDRSYFTERDRIRLSGLGLSIAPELEIKGARELYFFSRAFSYATDSVTLSYAAQDTRFKSVEPAEVIGRIALLTGGAVRAVKISSLSARDRLYSPEVALMDIGNMGGDYSAVREALSESGYDRELAISEGDISNTTVKLASGIIAGVQDRPLSLSQSRIDSYFSCPFGYFCRYTIGLGAEERAEFDARSIGSFIHAILENFFSSLARSGRRSGDLTAEERAVLTRESAERYISELGEDAVNASVRTKIKIDRLCRAARPVVDGLCEEFRRSAFEPRFFELRLSFDENSPDPVKIRTERGDVNIFGIIDRVDAYKKGEDVYLRVVDYKTGQKAFSPDDLAEGSNLQMFLYLKALVESDKAKFRRRLNVGDGGRLIPAGVIYVKTAVGDVKVALPDDALAEEAVKAAQGREGMVLDDPEAISAMNLRYTPLYSPSYPDEIRDNKRHLLYTEDGWGEIMQTVEGAVVRAADGIRDGEMSAEPKERGGRSPCEYCEFKPICRKK